MLLAIDAGNTNIVFALYAGDTAEPLYIWRSKTDPARTADEYAAFLGQMFALHQVESDDIDHAIISSVVPDSNFSLRTLCEKIFGVQPLFVGQAGLDTGVVIDLPRPEELGADRIVNAVAVLHDYQCPAIVIDCGTATTFDVMDANGHFAGGVIAPGANLSMTALHLAAAKLPKIGVAKPQNVIGNTTISAMQSGVYWGYVGLIEGMITRIAAELGSKPLVLATGGLAGLFAEGTQMIDKIDPDLTLRGLFYLHRRNLKDS